MADFQVLVALVERYDQALVGHEQATLERLTRGLLQAYARLEEQLRGPYEQVAASLADYPDARAAALRTQIQAILQLMGPTYLQNAEGNLATLIQQAGDEGLQAATQTIAAIDPRAALSELAGRTIPLESALVAAREATTRLARHGAEFAARASDRLVSGIVSGESFDVVARGLRRDLQITRAAAERIVRTESMAAHTSATVQGYQQAGIEGWIRVCTQDQRLCGHCAPRCGKAYPLNEQVLLHPNDRCYTMPFRRDWLENGLIDVGWLRNHARESQARAGELLQSASPFEAAAGIAPPTAIWEPGELDF